MSKYKAKNIPYTFARVSAMKTKLIKRPEYHKLLKMDLAAITRYLQESGYKEAITKMSADYRGIELIDQALKANQDEVFSKLIRISPDQVDWIIYSYMRRIDIQNLKVVIRGIYSSSKKEEVMSLIEPLGKYDEAYFRSLFEEGSVENALKSNDIVDFKSLSSALEEFRKTNQLVELENELDRAYYNRALSDAKMLSECGKLYADLILREIDILNIKNLLRLKREKMAPDKIMQQMIVHGKELNIAKLQKLASVDSLQALISALKGTQYEKSISFDEPKNLVELQLKLDRFILKSASLRVHQNPMTIMCVLSFMVNKIVELKNIRMIVKAKHLGIPEDYVENNLLI